MDVARDNSRGEQAEADLDRLITRRHDHRAAENGHRPSEELWQESVRTYNAKEENRLTWDWIRALEERAERAERNGVEIAARKRARANALRLRVGSPVELEESA